MRGGNGYADDGEEYSPEYDDDDMGDEADADGADPAFEGFYDRSGRRIRLTIERATIASPRDLMPPYADAGDYSRIRRRARF